MLDAKDHETLYSLRRLRDSAKATSKPILYWIGAGASAWCGYSLWAELADQFHSAFLRSEPHYDRTAGIDLIKCKNYPGLFQLCKDANQQRYFSQLAGAFEPKQVTPVYSRFIDIIKNVQPFYAVTTNIDECLEHNLVSVSTVQRSDLERCLDLLQRKTSFVCKLHGTVSSIESAVFTSHDYASWVKDARYLRLLQHLFAECTVVFVGYGLGDQYVVSLLSDNCGLRRLFGDGPHYLIATQLHGGLPETVNVIRYISEPHRDHRTVLQVLEVVNYARQAPVGATTPAPAGRDNLPLISAHFISDIYPPGTWLTSQNIELQGPDGGKIFAMTGLGWTNDDMPSNESTAMHDLLVGLLCFDKTYAPFSCAPRLHGLLGNDAFWEFVRTEAIRFVHWERDAVLLYRKPDEISGGGLASIKLLKRAETDFTIKEMIHRSFRPVPGKEQEAEELLNLLERKTDLIGESKDPLILETIKGLLMLPHIREQLGMSDGTPIDSIPRWLSRSVLRFANIVTVGITCQDLGIASTKLIFGATHLAEQAYSAVAGGLWVDQAAQYVLSGRFSSDLGSYVKDDPSIIKAVLRFRETQPAVALRREVLDQLSLHAGSEVVVSINNGLRASIPPAILEKARNEMSGLLIAHSGIPQITPALWNDHMDDTTARWREKSAKELKIYCEKAHIGSYEVCPCGSGDRFRFCCKETLCV